MSTAYDQTRAGDPAGRSRLTDRMASSALGGIVLNYALVLIFLWFGCLKFTQYEAAGIAPFIMNSPLVGWWHSVFGIAGAAKAVGVFEIVTGLLIAARPLSPRLGVIGGAMACVTFLTTLSFMFSTPGVIQPGFSGPFALSASPGQFLLKDVVLFAASLWVLLGARAEAAARRG